VRVDHLYERTVSECIEDESGETRTLSRTTSSSWIENSELE